VQASGLNNGYSIDDFTLKLFNKHMSRLFLASSFDKTIDLFIQKVKIVDPTKLSVGFIDIAAEPYKNTSDLFWVEQDYTAFITKGFGVTRVDLNTYKGDLSEFQILHFCGGHTRYLLSKLHSLGFFDTIKVLVVNDEVIYTGTSAGSMVVAPSLFGVGRLDDDIDEIFSEHDQVGLELVDFLILPHFQNPEFVDTNYESIKSTNYPHPLIFLNDNQAVYVNNVACEFLDLTKTA
jgi:dipeptidase E